jgi:hypothetical protein
MPYIIAGVPPKALCVGILRLKRPPGFLDAAVLRSKPPLIDEALINGFEADVAPLLVDQHPPSKE